MICQGFNIYKFKRRLIILARIEYPQSWERNRIEQGMEQPALYFFVAISKLGNILEDAIFPISFLGFGKG